MFKPRINTEDILFEEGLVDTKLGIFKYKIYKRRMSKEFVVRYEQESLKYIDCDYLKHVKFPKDSYNIDFKTLHNYWRTPLDEPCVKTREYNIKRAGSNLYLKALNRIELDYSIERALQEIKTMFNEPFNPMKCKEE